MIESFLYINLFIIDKDHQGDYYITQSERQEAATICEKYYKVIANASYLILSTPWNINDGFDVIGPPVRDKIIYQNNTYLCIIMVSFFMYFVIMFNFMQNKYS